MPTPTPCDRTQVGEKDDATEKLLLEMKTDREVLGETLDRASLDLRAKQVPPLHLITFLRPTPHACYGPTSWRIVGTPLTLNALFSVSPIW